MPNLWTKAYWLIREVGLAPLFSLAVYRLGLWSGYYRWRTPLGGRKVNASPPLRADVFVLPDPERLAKWSRLRGEDATLEAEEILAGQVRLFGGQPQSLNLKPPHPKRHWSSLHEEDVPGDIKQIWEPARFGWVFPLGRAYRLSGDERYAKTFWENWESFLTHNPVNAGENWLSAQEAALRLIALSFAVQVFKPSPHFDKKCEQSVAEAIIHHARRIEVTLAYARAQNNNHLVSEAVGLVLAAHLLSDWPEARRWRKTGWKWFFWAVEKQIEPDGEYIQHSVNYHRLMLTLALLAFRIAQLENHPFPQKHLNKLGLAAGWLQGVMDEASGEALNFGHHDGAHLLPLGGKIEDYRPILQASMAAFCGERCLPNGGWDELAYWLGYNPAILPLKDDRPVLLGFRRLGHSAEWASLRAHHYVSRPAHADQLQVELWRRGCRVVCDPGTYAYNLPPPWQNGLALAEVHNAPMFNAQQPMLRAGKFLWLRWDQARFLEEGEDEKNSIRAERLAYHRLGIRQERQLEWKGDGHWQVIDRFLPLGSGAVSGKISLNWLIRDGEWRLDEQEFIVDDNRYQLLVRVTSQPIQKMKFRIARAGQVLVGEKIYEIDSLLGWFSPTYLTRLPALSFWIETEAGLPFELRTEFQIYSK